MCISNVSCTLFVCMFNGILLDIKHVYVYVYVNVSNCACPNMWYTGMRFQSVYVFFSGHRLTTWWADLWMFISLVGPSSSWRWGHIIFRLILCLQKKNPFCSNKKHVKLDKYMANIPKSCCEVREWCVFSCHACWRRGTHSSPRRHERERWRPLSFSGALLIMDLLVVTWLSWPLQHYNHHCICTYSEYIYIYTICLISFVVTTVVDVLHEDGW